MLAPLRSQTVALITLTLFVGYLLVYGILRLSKTLICFQNHITRGDHWVDGGYQIIPGGWIDNDKESDSKIKAIAWIVYWPVHRTETLIRTTSNKYSYTYSEYGSHAEYSPWPVLTNH